MYIDLHMSFSRMASHIISIHMKSLEAQMQDKHTEQDATSCVPLMVGMDMRDEKTSQEEVNREK